MRSPLRAVALLLALTVPLALRAQDGRLRGRVVAGDSAGGRPIADAELAIPALGRATRSGADGTFALDSIPAGQHELRTRAVGFAPASRRVRVDSAGAVIEIVVALAARAQELATVDVRAAAAPFRAREAERARLNGGAFLDAAALERRENTTLANVLRTIPGVRIIRMRTSRGTHDVLGSRRGSSSLQGDSGPCLYQIIVDGVRRYSPDMPLDEPPSLDDFKVHDYEAVELYRSRAQTPTEFAGPGATCGTLVLWSRTRR